MPDAKFDKICDAYAVSGGLNQIDLHPFRGVISAEIVDRIAWPERARLGPVKTAPL